MKVNILGIQIDAFRKPALLAAITDKLNAREQVFLVTPYSESIVAAQQDKKFREILNAADFALPDGIGVLWAAKFLSLPKKNRFLTFLQLKLSLLAAIVKPKYIQTPIPEKISGSDFVWDLAGLAAAKNYSVFLLGGFGNTPAMVAQKLKTRFPDLRIAGTYTGTPTEQGIVEKINQSGADFLFAAFGPKKQEQWLWENRQNLRPRLLIGLGGTFDYLAGKRLTAPNFWAFRGLEWLWRLLTQPWRAMRIIKGVWGLVYYTFRFKLNNNK